MIISKGIIDVNNGYADTNELIDSVDNLSDGEYGYILFDKKKNRSLPQLKFLFGYILKTLSNKLEGNPSPEALYRYFEQLYAPTHICNIPREQYVFKYCDLKNEPAVEMDRIISKIIHHAMLEWNISLLTREELRESEAQGLYAEAYSETWKDFIRKI